MFRTSILWGLLFFCLSAKAGISTSDWSEIKKNRAGSVTVFYYDSDHFITSEKGQLKGIEYDLLLEFFRFLNDAYPIKIDYQFIRCRSFGELYDTIKKGKSGYFGACSFSITEQRLKEVQFSPKYMPDIEVLICSQNLPLVADTGEFIKYFKNATALSVPNTTFENNILALKNILPSLKINPESSSAAIRERISAEDNLFSYIELPNYFAFITKGKRIKRQLLFKKERLGYGIIYPLHSDWNEPIEFFFRSQSFKNKINVLIKKHLGKGVNDLLWDFTSEKDTLKNKEIILLAKEREIQNLFIQTRELELSRQRLIKNVLIAGVIVIIILLFLMYRRYLHKQKTARIIEEKNQILERLSIVARETTNVILILDADGTLEWVNNSFVKLNGVTLEELKKQKGNTIYDISNHPDIRKIVSDSIHEKKPVEYESLNKTADGKIVWESSTLTPIFDESGKIKKLVVIDTDITEKKKAQEIIQQKNKDITDSINCAERIQKAIVPTENEFKKILPDSFVLYKPKDIVSGDFYWIYELSSPTFDKTGNAKQINYAENILHEGTLTKNDTVIFAVCDCTGHGVPGALMGMLCTSFLNEAVQYKKITNPSKILDEVRANVIEALKQRDQFGQNEGMDAAVCSFDRLKNVIEYSGAFNPLLLIRNQQLQIFQADKQPVGTTMYPVPFTNHKIPLQKGDTLYIFSDGYWNQMGGEKGKKFKFSRLQELILSIQDKNMTAQSKILDATLESWKSNSEQTDDITIIGVRI